MTHGQFIALLISAGVMTSGIVTLLVAVLVWVRKDSKQTGKVEQQVIGLAAQMQKLDADRAAIVASADERIAEALRLNNLFRTERDGEIIETIKGFQTTVDDLKVAVANIQNMWSADRKLIERVRSLELELTDLRAQHRQNHPPTVSQRIVAEPGAPVDELFDVHSERKPR
jgi:hypothetical protein